MTTKPETSKLMRIFLSYGHDANEDLVRRIKADLEARGNDAWFDKNEIKAGDDWRREITDGITNSNRFISFLSKHSTRDPGVCLDEIAIAIGTRGGNIQTILVESESEVKPPASISHLQWFDMHAWKERKESGSGVPPEHPDSWETWYQAKLADALLGNTDPDALLASTGGKRSETLTLAIAIGLGLQGEREKDTPRAIRYYSLVLDTGQTNWVEFQLAQARRKALRNKP